ncbi:MAG: hypothetical protein FJY15_00410 [Bacteroidetes bacterium]|nr:hypothetical protein [Bacteroidota bacterium]
MGKGRKIMAKLRNKYRLVLLNDTHFDEVFSIRLTPMNLLMLLSSVFLTFVLLIYLLICFTPAKRLVPGFGSTNNRESMMELNQRMEDLSRELENKQIKIDALSDILSGKEKKFDSTSVRPASN